MFFDRRPKKSAGSRPIRAHAVEPRPFQADIIANRCRPEVETAVAPCLSASVRVWAWSEELGFAITRGRPALTLLTRQARCSGGQVPGGEIGVAQRPCSSPARNFIRSQLSSNNKRTNGKAVVLVLSWTTKRPRCRPEPPRLPKVTPVRGGGRPENSGFVAVNASHAHMPIDTFWPGKGHSLVVRGLPHKDLGRPIAEATLCHAAGAEV